jgi:sulfotransferase family protein
VSNRPPVLVHIGYHKTGTNWLQRHFFGDPRTGLQWVGKSGGDHPVRRLVRARPFEFDSAVARAHFHPLLSPVEDDGLLPVVSYERLSGHPFSGGYDSKEIASRLKDVFPEAKVLVVIREQRSMIVSTYKQYVKAGGPCSLPGFVAPPRSTSMRVPWFDFAHFEYEHLLRHYRTLFGEKQVLALAFDQFVRDPQGFVTAIGRFSGLPLDNELLASLPFDARSNPALSAVKVAIKRRRNRLAVRSELNPAPQFKSRLVKRATRLTMTLPIDSLVPRRLAARSEASLRRAVNELVGDRYRESNRATAQLTGIDLGGYGWAV